jgi:hypothetical protein
MNNDPHHKSNDSDSSGSDSQSLEMMITEGCWEGRTFLGRRNLSPEKRGQRESEPSSFSSLQWRPPNLETFSTFTKEASLLPVVEVEVRLDCQIHHWFYSDVPLKQRSCHEHCVTLLA